MPENMLIPPLCEQLIGHCAAHQAVRVGGSSGLGRLCLARRPSQASFSYTIALSGIGGKTTHFCQLSLPASARTSKGCREGDASSISKLQRQRPEQKYSLIVTYDLYIYELSLNPLKTGCNFGPEGLWEYWRSSGFMRGN